MSQESREALIEKIEFLTGLNQRKHSFETGKAGKRHKIYYENLEELDAHLEGLNARGLIDEEQMEA